MEVQIIPLEEVFTRAAGGELEKLYDASPDIAAGVFVFRPGQRVPESGAAAHSGTEISIVLSGEVLLGLEDGEERRIRAGELVIIPKGVPHYSRNATQEEARIFWAIAPSTGL